jgi:hypothetical protein
MNCHDAQLHLTEQPETTSEAVRQHLEQCPACRRFAALQTRLLEQPPASPSPELDKAVLVAAEFRLVRRRLWQRQRWLVAAAAGLLFAAWLAALAVYQAPPRQATVEDEPIQESIWADGELELALQTIAEGARLLEQAENSQRPPPSFRELDKLMLDFELKLNFERAVIGSLEDHLEG